MKWQSFKRVVQDQILRMRLGRTVCDLLPLETVRWSQGLLGEVDNLQIWHQRRQDPKAIFHKVEQYVSVRALFAERKSAVHPMLCAFLLDEPFLFEKSVQIEGQKCPLCAADKKMLASWVDKAPLSKMSTVEEALLHLERLYASSLGPLKPLFESHKERQWLSQALPLQKEEKKAVRL